MSQELVMYSENVVNNNYIINKILSKIVSDKIEKMLVQAFECVEDENYSAALKLYDLALKEEPDNTSVLIDKGIILQMYGMMIMC
jgi:thioredoxin-like negative regulator of GroEL